MENQSACPDQSFAGVSLYKISDTAAVATEGEIVQIASSPQNFVNSLIAQHNKQHRTHYERLPLELPESWKQIGFVTTIYRDTESTCSSLASILRTLPGAPQVLGGLTEHLLVFLERKTTDEKMVDVWELFALTTNAAWNVVAPHADYTFPLKIAKRLVETHFLSLSSRALAGPELASDTHYKVEDEYALGKHELESIWRIFKNFQSSLKCPSSLYALSPFRDKNRVLKRKGDDREKELPKKIGMEVRGGSLQVKLKLTMPDYLIMMDHFAKIGRGEQTYFTRNGAQEEEFDDIAFHSLGNIERIESPELKKRLHELLLKEVWRSYQGEISGNNLVFAHRHYRDYYRATKFTLCYKDRSTSFFYPLSYQEVLGWMRQCFEASADFEAFCKQINKATLSFSGNKTRHKLTTLIHGEFALNKVLFFRVDGLWLRPTGEHQAILERDFFQLVTNSLIRPGQPGHLDTPWISTTDWTRLKARKLPLNTDWQVIRQLKEARFSFVDQAGKVLVPYVTRCILEGGRSDRKIQKNWGALNALLAEMAGQTLTEKDLGKIFPKSTKQKDRAGAAKVLLDLLKKARPKVEEIVGKTKVPVIKPNGIVLDTRLQAYDWSGYFDASIIANMAALYRFASIKVGSNLYPYQLDKPPPGDIRYYLPSSSPKTTLKSRIPKEVLEALQNGGKPVEYIVHGPISAEEVPDPPTRQLFEKHHRLYREVVEEEGYNRLFLRSEKPGYFVGDQVFGGQAEKVELFDIIHWQDKGPLFLYHVKKGFAHSTREACSQIRNAAQKIGNAINSSNYTLLQQLCQNVQKSAESSAFRANVKANLDRLPGQGSPEERFVNLFSSRKEKRKQIAFVYAFLDDGQEERLLEKAVDPGHQFQQQDFEKGVLDGLKQEGILDSEGRLTTKFLNMTTGAFNRTMSPYTQQPVAILKLLRQKQSVFHSVIAKVELLQVKKEVEQLGFAFNICQISRYPREERSHSLPLPEISSYDEEATLSLIPDSDLPPSGHDITDSPPLDVGFASSQNSCFASCVLQMFTTTPLANRLSSKRARWMASNDNELISQLQQSIAQALNAYESATSQVDSHYVNDVLEKTTDYHEQPWNDGAFHDFLELYSIFADVLRVALKDGAYLRLNPYERAARFKDDSIQGFLNRYKESKASYLPIGIERKGEAQPSHHPVAINPEVVVGTTHYELVAFVSYESNHSHYVAYKRVATDCEQWVRCSDAKITSVSLEAVCAKETANVVFVLYKRTGEVTIE